MIDMELRDHQDAESFRLMKWYCIWACALTLILILVLACAGQLHAEEHSDTAIVNAIFVIEGGYRADHLYGIRSVKYANEAEARRICFNTVRNNRKRFAKQTTYTDYLDFLASRYCPVTGNLSTAERKLNKFWIGNLRKQLARRHK